MTSLPDHPLAPPSGILTYSRIELYEKIGPGPHACHWCQCIIDWKTGLVPGALIVDHLDWNEQNNAPENLVPSCITCNSHRRRDGDASLIKDDELTVEIRPGGRTRAVQRECEYCGKTFLAIPAKVKSGKGKFCSRECMYNRNKPKPPDMSGAK